VTQQYAKNAAAPGAGGVSTDESLAPPPPAAPPAPSLATVTEGKAALTPEGRAAANRDRIDTSDIKDGNDECAVSAKIDGNYSCNGTRTLIDTAKVTNALSQTAGSIAVQASGASSMSKAQAEGKQSTMMEAAADTQELGAKIQMATGAVNAVMGILQFKAGSDHKSGGGTLSGLNTGVRVDNAAAKGGSVVGSKNAAELSLAAGGGPTLDTDPRFAGITDRIARQKAIDAYDSERVKAAVGRLGTNAASEQARMAKEASAGGLMSTVTGAQQLISGGFGLAAAGNLRKAAETLKAAEGNQGQFMKGGELDLNTGTGQEGSGPSGAGAFRGTASESTATAAVEDTAKAPNAPNLGAGFNPNPTPTGLAAPGPGAIGKSGGGSGGGGGGGGGGMPSIGGTSNAAAQADGEPQSKASDARAGSDQYSLVGSAPIIGGGGGGGGGAGVAPPPDVAGMLAALMGKKGEEEQGAKGVLDFGGAAGAGGRGGGNENLHDSKTNLFERIHQTYQDKQRKQAVGK